MWCTQPSRPRHTTPQGMRRRTRRHSQELSPHHTPCTQTRLRRSNTQPHKTRKTTNQPRSMTPISMCCMLMRPTSPCSGWRYQPGRTRRHPPILDLRTRCMYLLGKRCTPRLQCSVGTFPWRMWCKQPSPPRSTTLLGMRRTTRRHSQELSPHHTPCTQTRLRRSNTQPHKTRKTTNQPRSMTPISMCCMLMRPTSPCSGWRYQPGRTRRHPPILDLRTRCMYLLGKRCTPRLQCSVGTFPWRMWCKQPSPPRSTTLQGMRRTTRRHSQGLSPQHTPCTRTHLPRSNTQPHKTRRRTNQPAHTCPQRTSDRLTRP